MDHWSGCFLVSCQVTVMRSHLMAPQSLSRSRLWSLQRYFMKAGMSRASNIFESLTSKCSQVRPKYWFIYLSSASPCRFLCFSTTSFAATYVHFLFIRKAPDGLPLSSFCSNAYSRKMWCMNLLGESSLNSSGYYLWYSLPSGVMLVSPAKK